MNLSEIQDLIKFVSKSGVTEVEIEQNDFKITIKSDAVKKRRGRAGAEEALAPIVQQVPVAVQGIPQVAPMNVMPQAAAAPIAAAPAPVAAPAAAEAPAEDNSKYVEIKSPMIGTFYRSSAPDKPPFAEVGDSIKTGDVVCIIEAMKLFNEIESEMSGKIVKILVDDNSPVEYDQPLFLIDPS